MESEELLRLGLAGGRLEQPPRAAAEVADVEAALLGGLGDALREVERVVDEPVASPPGLLPIAAMIARSVREATIGPAIPSTQTRVRAPCPRSLGPSGSSA